MVNKAQLDAQNAIIEELKGLIVKLQEKVEDLEKKQMSHNSQRKAIFQKKKHGQKCCLMKQRKVSTLQTSLT